MAETNRQFVSRGDQKLDAALAAFQIDVAGRICADFGCNVGGFTDCLLARGAAKVYAVDTGYGALAWRLRTDPRVVVLERTNALHTAAPEPVDLVAIDVAWTPQGRIVPAALRWLKTGPADAAGPPCVVSLLKPHYELAKRLKRPPAKRLSDGQAEEICLDVCVRLAGAGVGVRAAMRSALRGKGGNVEFFLALAGAEAVYLRSAAG